MRHHSRIQVLSWQFLAHVQYYFLFNFLMTRNRGPHLVEPDIALLVIWTCACGRGRAKHWLSGFLNFAENFNQTSCSNFYNHELKTFLSRYLSPWNASLHLPYQQVSHAPSEPFQLQMHRLNLFALPLVHTRLTARE